ncbi:hypothetical protein [Fodinicola feengrottensis]|uniref:RCC1 domain-containing protein n=1 Tax=Fodinicola feengrottensis TaxID=435914 RepID=UPI0031DF51DE
MQRTRRAASIRTTASTVASIVAGVTMLLSVVPAAVAAPASSVRGWGDNSYGQLGDDTTTDKTAPVVVTGLTNVTAIATSEGFSFFLAADGTVRAAGSNAYGNLGTGDQTYYHVPTPVAGLANVSAIAAGATSAIALRADGTVWTWGDDSGGQLGDGRFGSGVQVNQPQQVPGLTGVTAIAAGARHLAALRSDGTVWTWGSDVYGELGQNKTGHPSGCNCNPTPTQVPGLTGISSLTAGLSTTGVLTTGGAVLAWGNSDAFGGIYEHDTPTAITGLPPITQLSEGFSHTLALTSDGTVWSWGVNLDGELGDGTYGSVLNSPKPVPGLTDITQIQAASEFSAALARDGSVQTWGNNSQGQLGLGTTDARATTPSKIPGIPTTLLLSTGSYAHHMFAAS